MMLDKLKQEVWQANQDLVKYGLVTLTWGNVSGINRAEGLIAIKPSGVGYESMTIDDIVIVDMDGYIVEGKLSPSSDTPTHIELYKSFHEIGGITHTHSIYATMYAQACMDIPCFGTTHADSFNGNVPVTRFLTKDEVIVDYEKNTGKVISERFNGINPTDVPGVLVAGHAPFTWGKDSMDSVKNSLILERIAQMAYGTLMLNPHITGLPQYISQKHYQRKHGPNSYYGQKS